MNDLFSLDKVQQNIQRALSLLKQKGWDALYISSSDIYLNEYVPPHDCHRCYFSGFTGSTAELLLVKKAGRSFLFVDGRYHEQAEKEIQSKLVEVVKVPFEKTSIQALEEMLEKYQVKKLALEADRTTYQLWSRLTVSKKVKLFPVDSATLGKGIYQPSDVHASLPPVYEIPLEKINQTVKEKLAGSVDKQSAVFVTSLDTIAWLSNCRGFGLPNQSTFLAKAVATDKQLHLFLPKKTQIKILEGKSAIKIHRVETQKELAKALGAIKCKKIYVDPQHLSVLDYLFLQKRYKKNLIEKANYFIPKQSIKTPWELEIMSQAFEKADKAIFEVYKWIKRSALERRPFSEKELYEKVFHYYHGVGVKGMSFSPITAIGTHSSMIHFGSPSEDQVAAEGDLILFDSGVYFEEGYATDCTRTILFGDQKSATAQKKKMYTLVLKGLLNAQHAIFPDGTWGSMVDMLARDPLYQEGFDYAHGTGHGIGILVHEKGARLAPKSDQPLKEGQTLSIEPGIYIPGVGGVRLENIVRVKKHPSFANMLCFESLCYVDFDEDLIDHSLLTAIEKEYLAQYQHQCSLRNRHS